MTTTQMSTRITELLFKVDDYDITPDELKELQKLLYTMSKLIDRDIKILDCQNLMKKPHSQ